MPDVMLVPDENCGHNVESRTCWCKPRLEQRCPVCAGTGGEDWECPHCEGVGVVPAYTDDPECPTVIIHNDFPIERLN